MKSTYKDGREHSLESTQESYKIALQRWNELNLKENMVCSDYVNISDSQYSFLDNPVLIFDPPYKESQASYNAGNFNYDTYWNKVRSAIDEGRDILVFDTVKNLRERGLEPSVIRNMRVNGKHAGSMEGMFSTLKDSYALF